MAKFPSLEDRLLTQQYPKGQSPLMEQKWENILFINWECDVAEVQRTLPPGLKVDTFQGKAYVGIQAFQVKEAKLKSFFFTPKLPSFSALNVQTFVYNEDGIPGIWFYNLSANQKLIVEMAKQFLTFPYHYANIEMSADSSLHVQQEEKHTRISWVELEQAYFLPKPDNLEFFLLERPIVYIQHRDGLKQGVIYHAPLLYKSLIMKEFEQNFFFPTFSLHSPHLKAFFASATQVEVFKPL
jgi:uncharacterized protein YqjF (DUF2071 family)